MEQRWPSSAILPKRLEPAIAEPTYALALDISNHQGPLSDKTIEAWIEARVKKVVIRIPNLFDKESKKHQQIAIQQIEMCQPHFILGAYQWLYWDVLATAQGIQIANWIREYDMEPIAWLDLEENTDIGQLLMVKHVETAIEGTRMECGIYTARGFWNQYLPQITQFNNFKLWDADWLGNGENADFIHLTNLSHMASYGGWTERAMRQYGWAVIGGVQVDVNVYRT